ncbi:MAG: hypothetical protein H6704_07320 [Myxococcales bacterium]|nr:hypothetical protein [Myxococcales bacterium]
MLTPSIRWRGRAATRAALERWLAAHPIDAPPGLTTVLHVLTRETLPAPAAHSVVFDNAHAPPLFGLDDPERLDRDDGRRRPSAALERRFAAWRAAGRPNALRVLARYPERAADVDWLMSEGWQLDELAGVLYRLPPRQVTALFARHPTRLREAARRLLLPAALLRRMASPERIAQRALQRLRSEMTYQRWSDWEVWACMGWFRPAWPPTSRLAPVFETLVRTPALDALVGELLGADDLPELIRRDLALRWARARPGAAARFAAGRLGWDVARVILAQLVWQPRGGLGLLREAALDAHWRVAYLGLAGLASRGAVPASPPRCRDPLVDLAWLTARPDRSQDCFVHARPRRPSGATTCCCRWTR